MSIRIRVACQLSLDRASPATLRAAIGKRLRAIAFTWLPDDESDPDPVAKRIEIVDALKTGGFRTWEIHWRREGDLGPPIRMTRNQDFADVALEKDELARFATTDLLRKAVQKATEMVSFDVQMSDSERSMAWPVALSAAAALAEMGKGVIHAKGEGWFEAAPADLKQIA